MSADTVASQMSLVAASWEEAVASATAEQVDKVVEQIGGAVAVLRGEALRMEMAEVMERCAEVRIAVDLAASVLGAELCEDAGSWNGQSCRAALADLHTRLVSAVGRPARCGVL
jgi:hypothetical protein